MDAGQTVSDTVVKVARVSDEVLVMAIADEIRSESSDVRVTAEGLEELAGTATQDNRVGHNVGYYEGALSVSANPSCPKRQVILVFTRFVFDIENEMPIRVQPTSVSTQSIQAGHRRGEGLTETRKI
jgi:hypothetical protein